MLARQIDTQEWHTRQVCPLDGPNRFQELLGNFPSDRHVLTFLLQVMLLENAGGKYHKDVNQAFRCDHAPKRASFCGPYVPSSRGNSDFPSFLMSSKRPRKALSAIYNANTLHDTMAKYFTPAAAAPRKTAEEKGIQASSLLTSPFSRPRRASSITAFPNQRGVVIPEKASKRNLSDNIRRKLHRSQAKQRELARQNLFLSMSTKTASYTGETMATRAMSWLRSPAFQEVAKDWEFTTDDLSTAVLWSFFQKQAHANGKRSVESL